MNDEAFISLDKQNVIATFVPNKLYIETTKEEQK